MVVVATVVLLQEKTPMYLCLISASSTVAPESGVFMREVCCSSVVFLLELRARAAAAEAQTTSCT